MTSAGLALAAATLLAAPATQAQAVARDTLKALVEVDTSEPHGSTAAVAVLAARLKAAGFADPDVQVLAPSDHPEKANLVVRLRGRGVARPVMWMCHLDVVVADPADWSAPPFALTERDGWYYGRGVADMKGEAAAVAASLVRLRREGVVPDRDIVAIFTADEEAAGHVDGVRWLLAEHRPLVDAAFAINPDVGGGGTRQGRPLFFGVQTAEKTYATYWLTTANKGGHSSQPQPDNAIYRLSAALTRLSTYRFPVRLTATTRAFLDGSAALEPDQTRRDMRALATDATDAQAADRLGARPDLNALIRTTCVATQLAAGEAENALPQHARAAVQCRLLPGDMAEDVLQTLRATVADPQVEVALARSPNPSPETVPDPQVLAAIGQVVDGMWRGLPVVTRMDAGGSDAIFTRAAGIPTYGVGAILQDIDDNRHHARDERISTAAFDEGVEFTYRLMRQLSMADLAGISRKRTR